MNNNFHTVRSVLAWATTLLLNANSPCGGAVTISIGGATLLPSEDIPPSELVAAADQALYQAKREGRNRFRMAGSVELATLA